MSGSSQWHSVVRALKLAGACVALTGLGFVSGVDFAQRHRDPMAAGDFGERGDWYISFQQPASGRVTYPPGDGEPIRVQLDRADAAAAWRAQLMFPAPSLVRGTTYRVTFRARADRPRRMGLRMMEDHPSFQAVGLVAEMQVETDWRPYEWTFVSTTTDDRVNVVFNVGESTIPLEISHLAVQPHNAVEPHNAAAAVEPPKAEAAKKSDGGP